MNSNMDRKEPLATFVDGGPCVQESLKSIDATVEEGNVKWGTLEDVVFFVEVDSDCSCLGVHNEKLLECFDVTSLKKG